MKHKFHRITFHLLTLETAGELRAVMAAESQGPPIPNCPQPGESSGLVRGFRFKFTLTQELKPEAF